MATVNTSTRLEQLNASAKPTQIRLERRSPAYWRVTGPEMVEQFQEVINAPEAEEHVRVAD